MTSQKPIEIEIRVEKGAVICTEQGGNVRGYDREVTWFSDHAFTLEFFHLPIEQRPKPKDPAVAHWPFAGGDVHEDFRVTVRAKDRFTRRLRDREQPGVYKYTVTVLPDRLQLDPIIIIE